MTVYLGRNKRPGFTLRPTLRVVNATADQAGSRTYEFQVSDDPDFEYLIIDSTIVRAHQHASGAKGGLKIRPSAAHAAA